MEKLFYEKREKLFTAIAVKSIVTCILLFLINQMGMNYDNWIIVALFFLVLYSFVSLVEICSRCTGNWFLGLIGAIILIFLVAFFYAWAEDKDTILKAISYTIAIIINIGILFIDVLRLIIVSKQLKKSKKDSTVAENALSNTISSLNTTNTTKVPSNRTMHYTGDIAKDTNFLLAMKNDGIISEEEFQNELIKITRNK